MKKILTLALAIIMVLSILCACGKEENVELKDGEYKGFDLVHNPNSTEEEPRYLLFEITGKIDSSDDEKDGTLTANGTLDGKTGDIHLVAEANGERQENDLAFDEYCIYLKNGDTVYKLNGMESILKMCSLARKTYHDFTKDIPTTDVDGSKVRTLTNADIKSGAKLALATLETSRQDVENAIKDILIKNYPEIKDSLENNEDGEILGIEFPSNEEIEEMFDEIKCDASEKHSYSYNNGLEGYKYEINATGEKDGEKINATFTFTIWEGYGVRESKMDTSNAQEIIHYILEELGSALKNIETK